MMLRLLWCLPCYLAPHYEFYDNFDTRPFTTENMAAAAYCNQVWKPKWKGRVILASEYRSYSDFMAVSHLEKRNE